MSQTRVSGVFPLPDDATDTAGFVRALRALKLWAGDPSLEVLRRRTGIATSTLSDAINPQRQRLPSLELVRALVRACGADPGQAAAWERAWRTARAADAMAPVAGGHIRAAGTPALPPSAGPLRPDPGQDWIPRQLPPDVSGFTGRDDALVALDGVRQDATVTVITGTAGVGKTALAVHFAHQITERYPDGQLYLDLRGRAGDPALMGTEALSLLLQSLGVPGERIPVDLNLQMGLYRSVLAQRRVLIVLDNVLDAAHVRPLLPSGAGCRALVTSRDALTGLVVREGAARIPLDVLTPVESVALLAAQLGPERIAAEADAAGELAQLCAHLPLALRIAAANLAVRPAQSTAGMVKELGGADLLARLQVVGDPESAVAAAFDLSYRSLSGEAQRLFRLRGLVPGPEVSREAAAVLLGRQNGDGVPELDELLAAHLLFEPRPGRFRSHDLLALYARRRVAEDAAEEREAALHRLLSWYLLSLDAAAALAVSAYWRESRSELALVGRPQSFGDIAEATLWLETELADLIAAVIHAADHGPGEFAWHLVQGLRGFLYTRRRDVDWLAAAQSGLRAAQARDHALGQAICHDSLALAANARRDVDTADEEFRQAMAQYDRIGHTVGSAMTANNLADNLLRVGDLKAALPLFEDTLTNMDANPGQEAVTRLNLCLVHRGLGNLDEALRYGLDAVAALHGAELPSLMGSVPYGLALVRCERGEIAEAEQLLVEAREIVERHGSQDDLLDNLAGLVLVHLRTGSLRQASACAEPLHELVRRGVLGNSDDLGQIALVELYLAAGRYEEAEALGDEALRSRLADGHRLVATRLRLRLGRVHLARGAVAAAREQWRAALPFAIEQSLPERAELEELLRRTDRAS